MRKIYALLVFILMLGVSENVLGQCACAGTNYGSVNVAGWTVGQSQNIATNIYAGERSTILNTVAGAVYRVSTCGASYDTQLTIYTTGCAYIAYNDDNGPACAGTRASVDFTSPGGDLYAKLNRYNCATNTTNTTVSVTLISLPAQPDYKTNWISMNVGSTEWCAGETRNISVTVQNTGLLSWADAGGNDFNVGVKWNAEADYFVRVDAQNLAPGATSTFNFTVTAPATVGSNNLTFDVVREGCFWFANNSNACGSTAGPGNIVYTSPTLNIKALPTAVSAGSSATICPSSSVVLNATGTGASTNSPITLNFTPTLVGDEARWQIEDLSGNLLASGGPYNNTTLNVYTNTFNVPIRLRVRTDGFWNDNTCNWELICNGSPIGSGSVGAGQNTIVISNVSCTAPAPITYAWSPGTGLNNANIQNPTASPSSTTNYTVTAISNGCSVTSVPITVTVNQNPTANAGGALAAICQGGTSASMGGSVGGGATGGTWSGGAGSWTNANNPATATYTAGGAESGTITLTLTTSGGSCGTTFVTKTINIDQSSVAASSINNLDPSICHGASMQLDVVGGSLAPGAQWEWFESTCGSTVIGTGASISVIPSGNTTYLVRANNANSCAPSACTSISVSMPAVSTNLSINGDVATCTVNSNNWIHFYDANARLIASVNSNGQDLGDVTATTYVASNPFIVPSCTQPWDPSWFNAALARSFVITPTTQPTNPVSVRLYILDSEFSDYQAAAAGTTNNPNDDVVSIMDLDMTKHSGTSQDGDPLNNCGGGSTIYVPQSGSGLTSAVMGGFSGSYYIEYSIGGFSEMFPMNSSNSPLPVTLTSFNANCTDDKVNVTWTTASEFNASHYSLQTSRDGQTWTEVAQIEAAGTTNQESSYFYQDFKFGGISYYRLVQVDLDGTQEVYGPISTNCTLDENNMTVYPNPTDADFTVLIQTMETFENATIELVDLSGRSIEVKEMNILPGSTTVKFETKNINPGTYIVRIKGENDKFTPLRIVVL